MALLPTLKGAFCLVFMTENTLYAARDPQGIRPLVIGRLERGWVVASETAALDIVGASYVREVAPGDVFEAVVPFLILLACALLVVQPWLAKQVQRRSGAACGAAGALSNRGTTLAAACRGGAGASSGNGDCSASPTCRCSARACI